MIEIFFGLFLLSSLILAYKCYQDGVRKGAENALLILHEQKIICYDNKGNIKPNPFFDHDQWVDLEKEMN